MSSAPFENRVGIARPTVTIAVFRSDVVGPVNRLECPDLRGQMLAPELYAIQFQTKFDGGLALPGEGWDHIDENPEDAAIRCAWEELGLRITREQLYPYTTRAHQARDTREKAFLFRKMTHGREVPEALAGVDEGLFYPDHCIDQVFVVTGVDIDPAELTPQDTVEVARITTIKLDEELPPLPISDDELLVRSLAEWRSGELERNPTFLHFPIR